MHSPEHSSLRITGRLVSLLVACAACGGSQPPAASPTSPAAPISPSATDGSDNAAAGAAPMSIERAVAGAHRSEADKARDRYRHPRETLEFLGVRPDQRVIELWPGDGWYTAVLAPLLRDQGLLIDVVPPGHHLETYQALLASHPEVYDRVQIVHVTPPDNLSLGPDASADVVLTFRNMHNWISGGYAPALHAAIARVLKPGGVYGVVEHRAAAGTSPEQSAKSGYVSEDAAIALAEGAGLKLEARSDINANPKDTKDYPEGVWTLPPTLRLGDKDRDRYLAIGESDRMTLRFRKPSAP